MNIFLQSKISRLLVFGLLDQKGDGERGGGARRSGAGETGREGAARRRWSRRRGGSRRIPDMAWGVKDSRLVRTIL